MKINSNLKINISKVGQSTTYVIGSGLLENLDLLLEKKNARYSSFLILADKTAFNLFGKTIAASLKRLDKEVVLSTILSSEQNKDLSQISAVVKPFFKHGFKRSACLISIGGGMITDLGGFIASILLRGIASVYIPTTLLSQVDAAIGGKTGVNFRDGSIIYKNMLGTFKQPDFVISDTDTLATLPEREIKSGLGEIVKYWVGWGKPEFSTLAGFADMKSVSKKNLAETISVCQKIKTDIITTDPQDLTGEREKLNLGHTIGHAIEGAANGKLTHGEAVSIGLVAAAKLSLLLNLLPKTTFDQIVDSIKLLGLPTQVTGIDKHKVFAALKLDKKGGTFVLIEDIGKLKTGVTVESKLIEKLLEEIIVKGSKL